MEPVMPCMYNPYSLSSKENAIFLIVELTPVLIDFILLYLKALAMISRCLVSDACGPCV
jgi:hypothetical protein